MYFKHADLWVLEHRRYTFVARTSADCLVQPFSPFFFLLLSHTSPILFFVRFLVFMLTSFVPPSLADQLWVNTIKKACTSLKAGFGSAVNTNMLF